MIIRSRMRPAMAVVGVGEPRIASKPRVAKSRGTRAATPSMLSMPMRWSSSITSSATRIVVVPSMVPATGLMRVAVAAASLQIERSA